MATSLGEAPGVVVGTLVGNTVAELVASPEAILQLLGGVPLRPRMAVEDPGGAPAQRRLSGPRRRKRR